MRGINSERIIFILIRGVRLKESSNSRAKKRHTQKTVGAAVKKKYETSQIKEKQRQYNLAFE